MKSSVLFTSAGFAGIATTFCIVMSLPVLCAQAAHQAADQAGHNNGAMGTGETPIRPE